MQNLYNNFYHNIQAGVLFTMNATKEMNNEFNHCSTIPSEPNFILNRNLNMGKPETTYQNNNAFSLSKIGMSTEESGGRLMGI